MQILRSGKECYIQECSHCNCLFSYGRADIEVYNKNQNDVYYLIKCPECAKDLSPSFKKRIKE